MLLADNHVTIDDYQVFGDAFYLLAGYFRVMSMRHGDSSMIAASLEFHKLSERSREIAARIQKEKQEQEKMRQWKGLEIIGPALLVIGLFVFGGVRVAAQDVTPSAPPPSHSTVAVTVSAVPVEVTPAAPSPDAIVLEPGSSYSALFVVALVVVTLGAGAYSAIQQRNHAKLLNAIVDVLKDKRVQDETERKYMEGSLSVQNTVNLLGAVFRFVGSLNVPVIDSVADAGADFLSNIVDGQPNLTAEQIVAIRTRAVPVPEIPHDPEG